jgi:hypothetical protein
MPGVTVCTNPTTTSASQSAIVSTVEAFYRGYLASSSAAQSSVAHAFLAPAAQQDLLTETAVQQVETTQQYDVVTCSQNPLPFSSYVFPTPTVTGSSGAVVVTGTYSSAPSDRVAIDVAVGEIGGHWEITSFTCPAYTTTVPTTTTVPATTTADFLTPTANVSCEINYQRSGVADGTYCQTLSPPQSATMSTDGTYTTCTGPNCVGNPGVGTPTLAYGDTAQVGPFSCVSAVSGVTCTVAGRGFTIARSGIAPAGASAPSVTAPAPTIPATTMSTFAGTWGAHQTGLVINKAGTGDLHYQDLSLCPSCSFANAPMGTLVFVLTSLAQGVATGKVTATSDPKNDAMGAPVQVSLTAGSPGQILKVVIGGRLSLFCNSTSVGQCGA